MSWQCGRRSAAAVSGQWCGQRSGRTVCVWQCSYWMCCGSIGRTDWDSPTAHVAADPSPIVDSFSASTASVPCEWRPSPPVRRAGRVSAHPTLPYTRLRTVACSRRARGGEWSGRCSSCIAGRSRGNIASDEDETSHWRRTTRTTYRTSNCTVDGEGEDDEAVDGESVWSREGW